MLRKGEFFRAVYHGLREMTGRRQQEMLSNAGLECVDPAPPLRPIRAMGKKALRKRDDTFEETG